MLIISQDIIGKYNIFFKSALLSCVGYRLVDGARLFPFCLVPYLTGLNRIFSNISLVFQIGVK